MARSRSRNIADAIAAAVRNGNISTDGEVSGSGGLDSAAITNLIDSDYIALREADAGGSGVTLYDSTGVIFNSNFDSASLSAGSLAYIDRTNNFYIWNDSGSNWYEMTKTLETGPLGPFSSIQLLVAAGGGGGGKGVAGGGGAGGYRYISSHPVSTATSYTITIGGGGAGSTNDGLKGTSGSNTSFDTITSTGGGGGGSRYSTGGVAGGSGGGGAYVNAGGGAGTSGQGNNGGSSSNDTGGGGGGAAEAGDNATTTVAGDGGNGLSADAIINSTDATASSVGEVIGDFTYFAGGGGGGSHLTKTPGTGGSGGGGDGSNSAAASSSSANTAGGGGGGGYRNTTPVGHQNGGSGGSGIVIVRYNDGYDSASTTGSPDEYISDGFKHYVFKSSGSITFSG